MRKISLEFVALVLRSVCTSVASINDLSAFFKLIVMCFCRGCTGGVAVEMWHVRAAVATNESLSLSYPVSTVHSCNNNTTRNYVTQNTNTIRIRNTKLRIRHLAKRETRQRAAAKNETANETETETETETIRATNLQCLLARLYSVCCCYCCCCRPTH